MARDIAPVIVSWTTFFLIRSVSSIAAFSRAAASSAAMASLLRASSAHFALASCMLLNALASAVNCFWRF